MHKEILTEEQISLLPAVNKFSKQFGLVGGTAIALHLGHRRSVDFDLFSVAPFDNLRIKSSISHNGRIYKTLVRKTGEYTIILNGVKVTFFHYPYAIPFEENVVGSIKMPDLLTLAAMKAYALGRRAKWKDYVDIRFIANHYNGIEKIVKRAKKIFGAEFNEKIFYIQLTYFKDIDYSEKIIYMKGFEESDKIIKKELIDFSLR